MTETETEKRDKEKEKVKSGRYANTFAFYWNRGGFYIFVPPMKDR